MTRESAERYAAVLADMSPAPKPDPFQAPNGGARDLYDVRRHVQQRGQSADVGSVAWFLHSLRDGKYALGYPKFWLTQCGETLSYEACLQNAGCIARSIRDGDGWRCVVACDVNWEDPDMICSYSNERIESAYADDETHEPTDEPER